MHISCASTQETQGADLQGQHDLSRRDTLASDRNANGLRSYVIPSGATTRRRPMFQQHDVDYERRKFAFPVPPLRSGAGNVPRCEENTLLVYQAVFTRGVYAKMAARVCGRIMGADVVVSRTLCATLAKLLPLSSDPPPTTRDDGSIFCR
ncbi:hypothetical protein MTO96_000773 [Rhipicephalus appendiculatus]